MVTNQSAEESRESSSTTEAEDAPAGADEERANEPKPAPGRAVPEPAAAPAIAGEEPEQDAPLDQGATPGPSSGVAPVAEPGLEEPPAQGRSRSPQILATSLSGWCRRSP